MTDDIKLPLLEIAPAAYKWAGLLMRPEDTVGLHRRDGVALYKKQDVQEYARAAVLADREARFETTELQEPATPACANSDDGDILHPPVTCKNLSPLPGAECHPVNLGWPKEVAS